MPADVPDIKIRRPTSFPFCGRLIALPTSTSLQIAKSLSLDDETSIDFPAMPDTIELVRQTEYLVHTNQILPDGIHMYKGTRPLEIPFSFRLHSMDEEFCPNGALTLLRVAARLHSFVLPISTHGDVSIFAKAGDSTNPSNQEAEQSARSASPQNDITVTVGKDAQIFNPVTCRLELIYTEANLPGIACVGYVRDVNVKLHGPWMRGPGRSYNLPTAGEFSFTFVHRPGHGNVFSTEKIGDQALGLQPQAHASWVKDKLFNTLELVQVANYRGFSSVPVTRDNEDSSP